MNKRGQEKVMDVRTLTLEPTVALCSHLLRFDSLYDPGRAVAVPCDEAGIVDMDSLTQRLRNAYLGARALVGREYGFPTVHFAR
jgi:prophage tail gpP-like protein